MTSPFRLIFVSGIAFLSVGLSLCKGSTSIPLDQLLFSENKQINLILMELRLPRTLTAFVSGGLLALAGSFMQLLLQNPLADPYVLGVSSGAALVTLLLMLFGIHEYGLVVGAWLGGLLSVVFILLFAKKHRFQTHTLLLLGIALASGLSACISFILLISPNENLRSMLFWLAGDLNDASMPYLSLGILGLGLMVSFLLAPGLNLLNRGELEAKALGLATQKYRIALYFFSTLFTAAAVTMVGCIGFIGLIIPHFTRLLMGSDHRMTLPISVLLGGTLLTFTDTISRTLFAPQQLPVGMLMAFIGVPFFIWLLQK